MTLLDQLNALVAGVFLLTSFGLVVTRQILGVLQLFVIQSLLLATSACLVGFSLSSGHLFALAIITLLSKTFFFAWLLRRLVPEEVYTRREFTQALNSPTSLLVALVLSVLAYVLVAPLPHTTSGVIGAPNLPIGLASLLLGAYSLSVRREAVPQLLGLLAMENGAFFVGVAVAPGLPVMAELAIALDVLAVVFLVGVLTRAIHEHIGSTDVGAMASLKE
jgi:hydrogenase-4 component E